MAVKECFFPLKREFKKRAENEGEKESVFGEKRGWSLHDDQAPIRLAVAKQLR